MRFKFYIQHKEEFTSVEDKYYLDSNKAKELISQFVKEKHFTYLDVVDPGMIGFSYKKDFFELYRDECGALNIRRYQNRRDKIDVVLDDSLDRVMSYFEEFFRNIMQQNIKEAKEYSFKEGHVKNDLIVRVFFVVIVGLLMFLNFTIFFLPEFMSVSVSLISIFFGLLILYYSYTVIKDKRFESRHKIIIIEGLAAVLIGFVFSLCGFSFILFPILKFLGLLE